MSSPIPDFSVEAEEVRAWLVATRGGAPFLSPRDGRLLVGWLEAGVPVVAILRAIDATAERRRKRRVRSPLTLHACTAGVARFAAGGASAPAPARAVDPAASAPGGTDAAADLYAEAAGRIAALTEPDREARARAACCIARAFLDAAWAREDRPARLAEAAADLAELRELLDAAAFAAACEELARDRLRARWPTMTATYLWEACHAAGA